MTQGIYKIINVLNNKFYVGSAVDFTARKRRHWWALRSQRHANRHLQSAWNKYGEENFKFEMLLECEIDRLCSEEHYWATLLNVHNDKYGYSITIELSHTTTADPVKWEHSTLAYAAASLYVFMAYDSVYSVDLSNGTVMIRK